MPFRVDITDRAQGDIDDFARYCRDYLAAYWDEQEEIGAPFYIPLRPSGGCAVLIADSEETDNRSESGRLRPSQFQQDVQTIFVGRRGISALDGLTRPARRSVLRNY